MTGLPIGLSLVAGTLCLVIAVEFFEVPRQEASDPGVGRVASVASSSGTPGAPDRHPAWVNEIMARPLFSPDRRPVETGVRGLPRLTGIVVDGSQRVAIFAAPANGHPIVAQAGTHVGAYEVKTIEDAGVTVAGPEGTTLVRPVFDASRPSAAAAPPVSSARAQPARTNTK